MGQQQLLLFLVVLVLSTLAVQGGVVPKVRTMPLLRNATVLPAPRVIGGSEASRGSFPHQAAIFIDDVMFCGGSLISDSYILTAGHCVHGHSHWIIYLGSLNLLVSEYDRQIAQSVDATLHEQYEDNNLVNDVALLYLRSPVYITTYVRPVELATDAYGLFEGNQATISGWGKTSDYTDYISNILYYAELTVISNAECAQSYNEGIVEDRTICATGYRVTSPCNGDSGGALVTLVDGKTLQIGVASFVSGAGCLWLAPSGYSRVTYFRNWITANSGV